MPLGGGAGQNVGLRDFCHCLTLLPPGASVFHKHMSSYVYVLHEGSSMPSTFHSTKEGFERIMTKFQSISFEFIKNLIILSLLPYL